MARIDDLINEIGDERVRKAIADEVKKLRENKKFGLVFENHLPELSYLYSVPIRKGSSVVKRGSKGAEVYRVQSVADGQAVIVRDVEGVQDAETVGVNELVVVKRYGEAIYPALLPVDSVTKNESKPYHTLINSDNYHALQLLLYCYEGKFDVIYIDPPYNTGAKDWKYNNDYVDKVDAWRHSKWLSMMHKRLLLAKRLLKTNGVMVITIDDNEVQNLMPLLVDLKAKSIGRAAIQIKPEGRQQSEYIMEAHEYALFVTWGKPELRGLNVDFGLDFPEQDEDGAFRWEGLMRRDGTRENRGSDYWYPFYVFPDGKVTTEETVGTKPIYPINTKKIERVWLWDKTRASENLDKIKAVIRKQGTTIYYKRREQGRVKPTSFWYGSLYNANAYGTRLLSAILPNNDFDYPKSVYSVLDCIDLFLPENGLVLDFFAGSGTTLHATCLLNSEDNGSRRCVIVTNNEVKAEKAEQLKLEGVFEGNPEFEKFGIADSITFPRSKFVIKGTRDDGTLLPGNYTNGRNLSDGFDENLAYFKLDFLDPHQVALKTQFQAVLPILWLMAGAKGKHELTDGKQPFYIPDDSPFAVLLKESRFAEFNQAIAGREDLTHVFLVTDSEDAFRQMSEELNCDCETVMLYKNYLDNFRLNVEREI
jgi:adenine-specific DNA-methyltransferase